MGSNCAFVIFSSLLNGGQLMKEFAPCGENSVLQVLPFSEELRFLEKQTEK